MILIWILLIGIGLMMSRLIDNYLDELFPNPVCELVYNSDYQLLMAIVLSAQSTDKRVNSVTPILFSRYSSLEDIRRADLKDLEVIIRPIGSYRKKSFYLKEIAGILVEQYNGVVPQNYEDLIKLPGVGRKTANVFLSEYYNYPAIAVDTHVERVSKRLGLADDSDSVLDIEQKLMNYFLRNDWSKRHLQLVLFGRYKCKAVKPMCDDCMLCSICKK